MATKFRDSEATKVLSNGNIIYNDNFDAAKYTITTLCALALNDIGKLITKKQINYIKDRFKGLKGNASRRIFNAWQYWRRKQEKDLIVGVKDLKVKPTKGSWQPPKWHTQPRNGDAWYSVGIETGKQGHIDIPVEKILYDTVVENFEDIRKITASYLSSVDLENDKLEQIVDGANVEDKFSEESEENF